jgi:hypothetical protein
MYVWKLQKHTPGCENMNTDENESRWWKTDRQRGNLTSHAGDDHLDDNNRAKKVDGWVIVGDRRLMRMHLVAINNNGRWLLLLCHCTTLYHFSGAMVWSHHKEEEAGSETNTHCLFLQKINFHLQRHIMLNIIFVCGMSLFDVLQFLHSLLVNWVIHYAFFISILDYSTSDYLITKLSLV